MELYTEKYLLRKAIINFIFLLLNNCYFLLITVNKEYFLASSLKIYSSQILEMLNVISSQKNLFSFEVLGVQLCFRRFPIDGFSGKWWSK